MLDLRTVIADVECLVLGKIISVLPPKNSRFTSKLINAQYPDYDKLIPRSVENTAIASAVNLSNKHWCALLFLSNEKFRGIRLQLDKDQLRIVANNPEQEEAEETIALEYEGGGSGNGF